MTRSAMTTEPRNRSILIPFADRVVGISEEFGPSSKPGDGLLVFASRIREDSNRERPISEIAQPSSYRWCQPGRSAGHAACFWPEGRRLLETAHRRGQHLD